MVTRGLREAADFHMVGQWVGEGRINLRWRHTREQISKEGILSGD